MSDEQTGQIVLLVAGPGNTVVERIALALRQTGNEVVVATEPQLVRDAAARARACIVVLAGNGADDLATSAALRQSFSALIPVVDAEQRPPQGNWTTPPITYGGFIGPMVAQIQAALSDPRASQSDIAQRMALIALPPISLPELKTEKEIKQEKRQASTKKWRGVILIARIALVLIYVPIALFSIFHRNTYPDYAAIDNKFFAQQGVLARQPYDAPIPGPGCDKGGGQWSGYDADPATCRVDGLLMTQKDLNYLDEVNFSFLGYDWGSERAQFFPKSYQLGAQIAIQDANGTTCAGLSFHELADGNGGQIVYVCADGYWEFFRMKSDGHFDSDLRTGFIPHAKLPLTQFALHVSVIGATMRWFVNDILIETVIDQTYLDTSELSLVVRGNDGAASPAVLFSQFHYSPQWNYDGVLDSTLASAQSDQQHLLTQAYRAARPGTCDTAGRAWWAPANFDNDQDATFQCTSAGFAMKRLIASTRLTEETFLYHNGLFPQDYRISVTLDLRSSRNGCAGYRTRSHGYSSYGYLICANGDWEVDTYSGSVYPTTLSSGTGPPCDVCTLSSTDVGGTHTISIDDQQVGSVTDWQYVTTGYISFIAYNHLSSPSTFGFSDFALTPL